MLHLLNQYGVAISPHITSLIHAMDYIEMQFHQLPYQIRPCHNDTVPSNFIRTNGRLMLIDFEYAGNNDPMWDLACLAVEAKLSNSQQRYLLKTYCRNLSIDSDSAKRFQLYLPVVEFWVGVWCLVQQQHTSKAADIKVLNDLATERFAHCKTLLEGMRLTTINLRPGNSL